MRVQMHAHATSVRLEIKVCFENNANAWGNKEAPTVLCYVVKHAGSG